MKWTQTATTRHEQHKESDIKVYTNPMYQHASPGGDSGDLLPGILGPHPVLGCGMGHSSQIGSQDAQDSTGWGGRPQSAAALYGTDRIMTSPDGITWTARTTPISTMLLALRSPMAMGRLLPSLIQGPTVS